MNKEQIADRSCYQLILLEYTMVENREFILLWKFNILILFVYNVT